MLWKMSISDFGRCQELGSLPLQLSKWLPHQTAKTVFWWKFNHILSLNYPQKAAESSFEAYRQDQLGNIKNVKFSED